MIEQRRNKLREMGVIRETQRTTNSSGKRCEDPKEMADLWIAVSPPPRALFEKQEEGTKQNKTKELHILKIDNTVNVA